MWCCREAQMQIRTFGAGEEGRSFDAVFRVWRLCAVCLQMQLGRLWWWRNASLAYRIPVIDTGSGFVPRLWIVHFLLFFLAYFCLIPFSRWLSLLHAHSIHFWRCLFYPMLSWTRATLELVGCIRDMLMQNCEFKDNLSKARAFGIRVLILWTFGIESLLFLVSLQKGKE